MAKTVKELIKPNIDIETGWFNQEINYYDLLTDILQAHEETVKTYADIIQKLGYEHKAEKDKLIKKIDKKDKEIFKLKQNVADLECNQYTLEGKLLYKEDFETKFIEYNSTLVKEKYVLKDNSKYDKLPSKDVK
ncbi:hypothetical protein [Spiroplasma endosymbiont of Glossina fuscipes fuscipes]|uniref:hypothetical protein n=1 Tax=Spiroplasma endosymbiont of Glossina fuscipes fuscipes TaxID=2004463 RepID=UPI003C7887BA